MTGAFWRVGHEYREKAGEKLEDDELLRWLKTDFGLIANLSNRLAYKFPEEDIRRIFRALRRELDSANRRSSLGGKSDDDGFRIG